MSISFVVGQNAESTHPDVHFWQKQSTFSRGNKCWDAVRDFVTAIAWHPCEDKAKITDSHVMRGIKVLAVQVWHLEALCSCLRHRL